MRQDKPFDVFLSHNSVDKPWAIQLKRSLEGRGLRVWLDRDEIRPGDLFVGALESGIQQSKAVVLVVSPESAHSGWVREEYSRAIDLAQGSDSPLQLIPAILRDAELPGFLKSRNWVDFRDASLFEESIERLVWGVTGKKPDDSSHIPKKKHALLDRRLTTELLVLLSQPHPPDPVVSGGAFQTLFSLAVFEQTLVEDHYGSTLASFVSSKEPRLGSCLLLIPPDREGDRNELLDVVEDAGDEWARDAQVQIAARRYGLSKGSSLVNAAEEIHYLQHCLILARRLDAALVPHPSRWTLFQSLFDHSIWAREVGFPAKAVVDINLSYDHPVFKVPKDRLALIDELGARFGVAPRPLMLVRHGPIPYPFPTSLLRKYERDYLASLPGFLYEFCAPSENAPS